MIHRTLRLMALPALAALFLAPITASAAPAKPNWNGVVNQDANGVHTLGNPAAKVQLTEYVSYTCSHCAAFHKEADAKLRLSYIPQGKVAVRVAQVLRNPVDLTVAMLTNCGDPKTFFVRHNAFMSSQSQWLAKNASFTPAQTARWTNGDVPTRLKAIASDFDFYAIMARANFSRPQVDHCLSNAATMKRVVTQSEASAAQGVTGTPSFAINGALQDGVHDWESLLPLITAKL